MMSHIPVSIMFFKEIQTQGEQNEGFMNFFQFG